MSNIEKGGKKMANLALKKVLRQRGFTIKEIAQMCNIPLRTFYYKLQTNSFRQDEIEEICRNAEITDVAKVFFPNIY
jgi:hypothetical protein